MKPKGRENDWQFWVAVPVVGIVLYAGLTLFHRCTELGRSLSVDGLAMVGTTLFAAATGFLAILFQVRSASRQLREQMADQHLAAAAEFERQKRAIATAIVCEIDSFYMFELDLDEKKLASWDGANNSFPIAAGLRTNVSEIYKGVSPLLGSLNAKSVAAIVKFYAMVGTYEGRWRNYQYCLDMLRTPVNPAVNLNPQNLLNDVKAQLNSIRDLIPKLKELAATVTNSVACDYDLNELIGRSDAQTH